MSCSIPNIYTNKINIYDNKQFIPLPPWRACPPPSMMIIAPSVTTINNCGQVETIPLTQPTNPPLTFCGSCIYPPRGSCAPCGK
jgi:hypothetical protein